MNDKSRKFTHVAWFMDDTDYIEVSQGESFRVTKKGEAIKLDKSCYPLSVCENFVKYGRWKEITE